MTDVSDSTTRPQVVFVILNWNEARMTIDCLNSIYALDYPTSEVIIVDNGSTDDSCEIISNQFPEVVLIRNETNVGYTIGNNIGIRCALEITPEYIFLLNNDTILDRDMLSLLVEVAESDPTIGITGPTMLYYDQPEIIWCAGNSIDWDTGETIRHHDGLPISTIEREPLLDVDFITSCAICIKRAVFQDIGLFDERFFIYYDETDWYARASKAGWRAVYVPWAKMWHRISATMGESSPRTDYYMIRNKFLFLAKNLRSYMRIYSLSRAVLKNLRTILAYTIKYRSDARLQNRNAKLMGMIDAIVGNWGKMRPAVEALCYPKQKV